MSQFRVGQRVRKVSKSRAGDVTRPDPTRVPVGAEGTIIGPYSGDNGDWIVEYDGYRSSHVLGWFAAYTYQLAPLTPPDSWASEKVRELVKPKPMDLDRVKEKA